MTHTSHVKIAVNGASYTLSIIGGEPFAHPVLMRLGSSRRNGERTVKYETIEDAMKVLAKTNVTVGDDKVITHKGDLSLKTAGAIDYLKNKHSFTIANPTKPDNWNIHIR